MMGNNDRKLVIAVIGGASKDQTTNVFESAETIGRRIVDMGFVLITGGMGGVMEAASRGARTSDHCGESSVIGVLPSYDRSQCNPYIQVAIATGMQLARNVIVVSSADVVVAVGGGAGTLSEIAFAWQLNKPVIALSYTSGWSQKLAGQCLDHRTTAPVYDASTVEEAIAQILYCSTTTGADPQNIGSGWKRSS